MPTPEQYFHMKPPEIRILIYTDDDMGFGGREQGIITPWGTFQGLRNPWGPFDGMVHLIETLEAPSDYWVRIKVTTIQRNDSNKTRGDPRLSDEQLRGKKLNEVELTTSKYDELWLFGLARESRYTLEEDEIKAVKDFMDAGGGVFATGDHEDLGAALCSRIPRVSKMRLWHFIKDKNDPRSRLPSNAPPVFGKARNTTLRRGYYDNKDPEVSDVYDPRNEEDVGTHDPEQPGKVTFPFDNQSDDIPQEIIVKMYPIATPIWWKAYSRPHPLLCSKEGIINVLPDHMHEGMVVEPVTLDSEEWPSKLLLRGTPRDSPTDSVEIHPGPEVIAMGTVVEPTARQGRQFGLIGAYDGHKVDVGRIVVDSTFHHFVDINLLGDWTNKDREFLERTHRVPLPTTDEGFLSTYGTPSQNAVRRKVLRKIDSYYRNIAVWLAPPHIHREMLHGLIWGAVQVDPIAKYSLDYPAYILGVEALEAMGKYASKCIIIEWLMDPFNPGMPTHYPLSPDPHDLTKEPDGPMPWMLEAFLLGHIIRNVREKYDAFIAQSASVPTHDEIDASFRGAVAPAMKDFVAFYSELASQAQTMAERFKGRSNEPNYENKDNEQQTDT